MSYSLHHRNRQSNPYYSGITVPFPGFIYGADATPPVPLTVADLDAYFAASLNGAAWAALTPEVKEQALAEAQRWLATLCWTGEGCCGRDYEAALLMATAELALALATEPGAIIGSGAVDGRWVKRERLDVLEQEYGLLADTSGQAGPAGDGRYPLIIQRFPWLKDILGCWLQLGPKREIRLYRN
jgi:hypothetical protein